MIVLMLQWGEGSGCPISIYICFLRTWEHLPPGVQVCIMNHLNSDWSIIIDTQLSLVDFELSPDRTQSFIVVQISHWFLPILMLNYTTGVPKLFLNKLSEKRSKYDVGHCFVKTPSCSQHDNQTKRSTGWSFSRIVTQTVIQGFTHLIWEYFLDTLYFYKFCLPPTPADFCRCFLSHFSSKVLRQFDNWQFSLQAMLELSFVCKWMSNCLTFLK